MVKIKNDRSLYTRRSDLVEGSLVNPSDRHRTPDTERAKEIASRLVSLKRGFVSF
jgi:hypothetical protein